MKTFYLTFGQKSPARNGWIAVKARDYQEAREKVEKEYGQQWANLYGPEEFDRAYFPAGELGELY